MREREKKEMVRETIFKYKLNIIVDEACLDLHWVVESGGVSAVLPWHGGLSQLDLEEEGLLQLLGSSLPRSSQQDGNVYLGTPGFQMR